MYVPRGTSQPTKKKQPAAATVEVFFVRGKDLPSADLNGFSDPYAIVTLLHKDNKLASLQTKTIRKNLNPEWNETLTFPTKAIKDVAADAWHELFLHIEIMDWDRVGRDDKLGELLLPLVSMPEGERKKKWFGLKGKSGSVELAIYHESPEFVRHKQYFQFGREVSVLPKTMVPGYRAGIPTILVRMKRYLFENGGLSTEGVFRLAPLENDCLQVKLELNKGEFKVCKDVNCMAHLMKVWCRDLPTRLLSEETVEYCQTAERIHATPEGANAVFAQTVVEPLKSVVEFLADMCVEVAAHEEENKMSYENLGIVFGPNLGPKVEDNPIVELMQGQVVQEFFVAFIVYRASHPPDPNITPMAEAGPRRLPPPRSARSYRYDVHKGDPFADPVPKAPE